MTQTDSNKIIRLQTQMENIEQKVDHGFADNKATNERIERKLEDFIAIADKKYANIWVEQGAKWALTLVIGAVIVALLSLTLK